MLHNPHQKRTLTHADHRTALLALERALLGLATILIHDGNSLQGIFLLTSCGVVRNIHIWEAHKPFLFCTLAICGSVEQGSEGGKAASVFF